MAAAAGGAGPRGWVRLGCRSREELRLFATLANGQCFGWRRIPGSEQQGGGSGAGTVWRGVVQSQVVQLREAGADVEATCLGACPSRPSAELRQTLRAYFQLDVPLAPLVAEWGRADSKMAAVGGALPGMRVVRQEPLECLVSFICSSNNNIKRITKMVESLRVQYGQSLGTVDGEAYHAFPTLEELSAATEQELRDLGFGYRAKFVVRTAAQLGGLGGSAWLLGLRQLDREAAVDKLMTLTGVGRKVAHCVALFSLDKTGSLPVDTHVWQIACRDFDASLTGTKSLTPTIFNRVGELFRSRYGPHAGWAHCLLFAAELPDFAPLLQAAGIPPSPKAAQSSSPRKRKSKPKPPATTAAAAAPVPRKKRRRKAAPE